MKKFSELTEQEILALAITNEEEDSRIYRGFAEGLREQFPSSAKVFDEMAEEEVHHRTMLYDLYRQKFGEYLPLIRRQDVQGFLNPKRPLWLMRPLGLEDVRKFAENMEFEAERYYRKAAEIARDASVRELLDGYRAAGIRRPLLRRLGRDVEDLADHLRHGGVRALAHVDGAAKQRGAAVAGDDDIGDRGGGRDHRLDGDGDAATAAQGASAAVEGLGPIQPLRHAVERALVLGVFQDLAGGVRTAFAQDVLAPEFERIDLERPRDHVGVALIGPHQLLNTKTA